MTIDAGLRDDETIAEWYARITPHYPTSAELAAFRRGLRTPEWWAYLERPENPLPNETQRRWGIPVQNGIDHLGIRARREAARMRSEAFVFLSANVPDLSPCPDVCPTCGGEGVVELGDDSYGQAQQARCGDDYHYGDSTGEWHA